MISVYNKKSNVEINARRLEQLEQWGSIIQYGRQNPVWFIEQILGCPLLDLNVYYKQVAYTEMCLNNNLSKCWNFVKLTYQSKVMKNAQV